MEEETRNIDLLGHEHEGVDEPRTKGKKLEIAFKYIFGAGSITFILSEMLAQAFPEFRAYQANFNLLVNAIANVALIFMYDME